MGSVTYRGQIYALRSGETMLDGLLRQGVELPFSCRNGVCQVCIMKAVSGTVPATAQVGIESRLVDKQYFLPCKCKDADLAIHDPELADRILSAVVAEKSLLTDDICRLRLEPNTAFRYHAGQFIHLRRKSDGMTRSYSLASVPEHDYFIELHVRCYPDGAMSRWLKEELRAGDELEFVGPLGDCYYREDNRQDDLLLVCNGTGLANLSGVARAALAAGHSRRIQLLHGVRSVDDAYLRDELVVLEEKHANFRYLPCISDHAEPDCFHGRVTDAAATLISQLNAADLAATTLYLAGSAEMVAELERIALAHGLAAQRIHKDPFLQYAANDSPKRSGMREAVAEGPHVTEGNWHGAEADYPPPEPELWAALGEGKVLRALLDEFYDIVFEDPLLAPYFHKTTKQRAKEKVYSFYRRVFSGEKVYFGDRPRNAHHWMVISDKIFNYRENLLRELMRKHGLSEPLIGRWLKVEERYRSDIVKDKAYGRMVGGIEAPAEGFGTLVLDVGSLCDACQSELAPGVEVSYHLRTGEIYCPACRGKAAA